MKVAVKVTFSAQYNQAIDKLYTYLVKQEDIINMKMNAIVVVETPDGLKNAQVKVIDWKLDEESEAKLVERYGPLKYAYSSKEVADRFRKKAELRQARL